MSVKRNTLVEAEADTTWKTGPRRRPSTGGYARGDEKRAQIIEAALQIFGEVGYENASTRQIALKAGVNPPALQYYFDGKEGLHEACAQYVAERMSDALEIAYLKADSIAPGDANGAIEALCDILDTLADLLFGSAHGDGWSRFIARSQSEGSHHTVAPVKKKMSAMLKSHCMRLVGIATSSSPDDTQTRLRTLTILGQLTVFHLNREPTLTLLHWPDFHGERLEELKAMVRTQTRVVLIANAR